MSHVEQRDLWLQNLRDLQAPTLDITLGDLPTLFDLEMAYRRVKMGKAVGGDGFLPEACHNYPSQLAKLSFAQLLKLATHGQEALCHKGGQLVAAHKRGPHSLCESFRSLLISSHQGKTLHRALRQHQSQLYVSYMQQQQLGGRPRIPVSIALHQARAYLRANLQQQKSVALIFLDLKEAFYRVLRPLALGLAWTDHDIASFASRLNMDQDTLHDLYKELEKPDALCQAELPDMQRRYLQALHTDTYFYMQGQNDVVRTKQGTRPGDSFADVVFGFLWARVLRSLESQLSSCGILDQFASKQHPGLFAENSTDTFNFIGPTWCDDLCLCVSHPIGQQLENNAATALGLVLDLCHCHGLTPNLRPGKTEILLAFKGKHSKRLKKKHFGEENGRRFSALGEHGQYSVGTVGEYKHLGGIIHASGETKKEARRRVAMAFTTFNLHRKILFHNDKISLLKRTQLFTTLVLSQFVYGMESWTLSSIAIKEYVHASTIRLYRRLLKAPHDAHYTDREICVQLEVPLPSTLLRQCRLRYLGLLYTTAPSDMWSLLQIDTAWTELVWDDILWMWRQINNASNLQDPTLDFAHWEFVMRKFPGYWKRLVRRAVSHEIAQNKIKELVHKKHADMARLLQSTGMLNPRVTPPVTTETFYQDDRSYGCMLCQQAQKTLAGEAVHMNRRHGQISQLRHLYSGSSCPGCLKEFHLPERVHQHLRHSKECKDYLEEYGWSNELATGKGSKAHQDFEQAHNGLLPCQQALGPLRPAPARREDRRINDNLLEAIIDYLEDRPTCDVPTLKKDIQNIIQSRPISWTNTQATLCHLRRGLDQHVAENFDMPLADLQELFRALSSPSEWPFLQSFCRKRTVADSEWERYLGDLALHDDDVFTQQLVPRPFFRERVILHYFSGRRRVGDLQHYIEQLANDGDIYWVVSLDIMVDAVRGNLLDPSVQLYWINQIHAGYIVGLLMGPPCETWSVARGKQLLDHDHAGPRILRTVSHPWGMESLGLRESGLLLFCFESLIAMAIRGGCAILEHPAEPRQQVATIWKLCVTVLLEKIPGFKRHRVHQGTHGSESSKPTDLLALHLETLPQDLKDHQLGGHHGFVASIGKSADGTFKTARLKEYPPAMNLALATAVTTAISKLGCVETSQNLPFATAVELQQLVIHEYGVTFGPDFHG